MGVYHCLNCDELHDSHTKPGVQSKGEGEFWGLVCDDSAEPEPICANCKRWVDQSSPLCSTGGFYTPTDLPPFGCNRFKSKEE